MLEARNPSVNDNVADEFGYLKRYRSLIGGKNDKT